jgi:hypothetical protein
MLNDLNDLRLLQENEHDMLERQELVFAIDSGS